MALRDWFHNKPKQVKDVNAARLELKARSPALIRKYEKEPHSGFMIQFLPERIDTLPDSVILELQTALHEMDESLSQPNSDQGNTYLEYMFLIRLTTCYALNGWFLDKFLAASRDGRIKL